jgi:hypothetical protein
LDPNLPEATCNNFDIDSSGEGHSKTYVPVEARHIAAETVGSGPRGRTVVRAVEWLRGWASCAKRSGPPVM